MAPFDLQQFFFRTINDSHTIGVIIFLTFLAYYVGLRENRRSKLLKKLKGPPPVPIFGNAFELAKKPEYFLTTVSDWCKIYGRRFLVHLGTPYVFIANAVDLEKVLTSQKEIFKGPEYKRLNSWLGNGLLTSSGIHWFRRRKMLTNAFHFKILEQYLVVFNEQANVLTSLLSKDASEDEVFNIAPYIARCSLDIICEAAMGRKINAQIHQEQEYIKSIRKMTELNQYRSVRPWLFSPFLWNLSSCGREEKRQLRFLHSFTDETIQERKKILSIQNADVDNQNHASVSTGKRRLAFLDLLIEAQRDGNNNLTDEDIRAETDTFMFEGHDTVSVNAGFTCFLIAANPNVQVMRIKEKVQDELHGIFGEDINRPITMNDLNSMKYLECCIKESLRLYPSVAAVTRTLQDDFVLDDEITIPGGTNLGLFPYVLHRDSKYFPNPEKFDPDRFLPENVAGRHPFAYVPFSAGPRNCIGQKFAIMEEKVMMANIFRKFTLETVDSQNDLVIITELTLRADQGINVKIVSRS